MSNISSYANRIGIAATLATSLAAVATPASAEPRIRDFSAKIEGPAPTIYVNAKKGKWHSIADRNVNFRVRIKANAKGYRNFIRRMAAGSTESFKMDESGISGAAMHGLAAHTFGGKGDRNKASATLDVATSARNLGLGSASRNAIIAACNKRLDQGKSVFSEQRTASYGHVLWAGVMADYYPAIGGFPKGSVSVKRNIGLAFNVVCLPDKAPYKTLSAKHSYKAPGNTCPRRLTIKSVIESNKPGEGYYRRERKGGPPSNWIKFRTKKSGNRYLFKVSDTQEVGHVDQVRRIRVKKGPASKWTHVKVSCAKFKVTHVKYAFKFKKGGTCPVPMTNFIALHGNQKGHAWVRHERKGGAPGKWFKLKLKKTKTSYVALKSSTQKVGKVDQIRRLKVKGGPASKWVHVKNSCPVRVNPKVKGANKHGIRPAQRANKAKSHHRTNGARNIRRAQKVNVRRARRTN